MKVSHNLKFGCLEINNSHGLVARIGLDGETTFYQKKIGLDLLGKVNQIAMLAEPWFDSLVSVSQTSLN